MPSKSSPRAGRVTRRADGRFVATVQMDGKRRSAYGRTEKEARAALQALVQQAAQTGTLREPGRRTLADLADAWLKSAPGLRPTTRTTYREFLTRYAYPELGRERLERITPDRLQRLYAVLKPSVAEKLHRILHRAFAVAVLWRWLTDNPCDRVMRPAYRPAERHMWSSEQAHTFIAGIEAHWLGPLFVLIATTGLRLGEALALRWEDAGLGVALSVTGTLHHVDGAPMIGAPKTASARRTVMLPPVAITALHRQRAQQDGWQQAAPDGWPVTPHIFTGRTGRPLHRCVPEAALKRLCGRLGLTPVTPHGLRHLHASLLLHEHVPITAVSARLGHANPHITLRLYAHALPGQDRLAAEAIDRALMSAAVSSLEG